MKTTGQTAAVAAMVAAYGSREEALAALAAAYGAKALPESDADFAALIVGAAKRCKDAHGAPVPFKVYVSHAISKLSEDGYEMSDASAIKARMVACMQANRLNLSRSDIPGDAATEAASQCSHSRGRATWHYIRLG